MPRESKGIEGDTGFLAAALEGLELQKQRIEAQIEQVKARLGRFGNPGVRSTKRGMSSAARKRIAAAQKKRWADFRKKSTTSQG
jgi:hypothetical protein